MVNIHLDERFEEQKMNQGERGYLDNVDDPQKESSSSESEEESSNEESSQDIEKAKEKKEKDKEEKLKVKNIKLMKHFSKLLLNT